MTAPSSLVDATFARHRDTLADLLERLRTMAEEAGNTDLRPVIAQMRETLREPFLFVVVGEIKAGKSSFVNALLGADVCRVDPAPCTDVIQEIVWADRPSETDVAPHLRRIGVPADILRDIAIVDTPGTNTIIAHHQEITQRYIPNSGLVIFVFPAKNPHTRSAWELLETVSDEWRKRVVFVLQQADLATAEELAVNTAKVAEYARERRIDAPRIFATSVPREQGGLADAGFDAVRRYIRDTVTGGRHFYLKLRAILDTSESIFEKIAAALADARQRLLADRALSDELAKRADRCRQRSEAQVSAMVQQILARYDTCAEGLLADFAQGLAVPTFFRRSVGAAVGRRRGLQQWLDGLQQAFGECLDREMAGVIDRDGKQALADIEGVVQEIVGSLAEMHDAGPQVEAPEIDFWQRREAIIAELRGNLEALRPETLFSEKLSAAPAQAGTTLVGGSAMTLVGALLLATTHITLLDVTGGILTGAGLFVTGGVLVARRGRMRREIRQRLQETRQRLGETLEARLQAELGRMHAAIGRQIAPLAAYVIEREAALTAVDERGRSLGADFARLSAQIDAAAAEG